MVEKEQDMTLNFIGGAKSTCTILKEGRKWIYFRADGNHVQYRLDKESGMVQVAPYWNTIKGMSVNK